MEPSDPGGPALGATGPVIALIAGGAGLGDVVAAFVSQAAEVAGASIAYLAASIGGDGRALDFHRAVGLGGPPPLASEDLPAERFATRLGGLAALRRDDLGAEADDLLPPALAPHRASLASLLLLPIRMPAAAEPLAFLWLAHPERARFPEATESLLVPLLSLCGLALAAHRSEAGPSARARPQDELLARLGHELRNPLAPIDHAARILEGTALDGGQRELVALIGRQARQLARVVDDLLDVAHLERGSAGFAREAFDLREERATPPPGDAGAEAPDGRSAACDAALRPTLLVVDDNRDAAHALAILLRHRGFVVGEAHDAHEALRVAESLRPGVVLLDIGLPDLDGYELARRLRARPENGGVRLVALTGYGSDRDRERSLEAGIEEHLVKPVDIDRLGAVIASPLSSRRLPRGDEPL